MTKSEFFKAWQVTKRLNHMSKREKMEALAFLKTFKATGWHFPMTDWKTDSRSDNPPSCGASIGGVPRFMGVR